MLLQIDGTFLIAGLSFIIFTLLMNVILYKPMVRILGEREDFYNKNSATVQDAKHKTKVIIDENDAKTSKTRKEAGELVKNASQKAKAEKAQKLKEAKEACDHRVVYAREKLNAQIKDTKAELKSDIETFVKNITTKVLGKETAPVELNAEKIEKLIGDINV